MFSKFFCKKFHEEKWLLREVINIPSIDLTAVFNKNKFLILHVSSGVLRQLARDSIRVQRVEPRESSAPI
jgi:hypothetical protein